MFSLSDDGDLRLMLVCAIKFHYLGDKCPCFGANTETSADEKESFRDLLLLLSIGPRWLMPRIYCSQIGLLHYPQTFQISPLVSFYGVLAARGGGDVYEPSYFRMFQLSPLVVFERS